jgi:hypothetical protein
LVEYALDRYAAQFLSVASDCGALHVTLRFLVGLDLLLFVGLGLLAFACQLPGLCARVVGGLERPTHSGDGGGNGGGERPFTDGRHEQLPAPQPA